MRGRANARNYFWSDKWQPGFGNQFARFSSGEEYAVLQSALRWPRGFGIDGWIKGVLGQKRYFPPGMEVGTVASQNPTGGEWKKFTGHERDQGSLDYMHARYYNPFVGRFLSVDPTWESAYLEMPQSWNRYSYVMNNPMKYTDPTGRVFKCHTITKEDGSTEQICSEEIDVEAEEPGVAPEPEPEPQQAGFLPVDFGSSWDRVQHETENLKHLTANDLSFRHAPKQDFGQCIESNSFSNVYTAIGHSANAIANKAVDPLAAPVFKA